VHCLTGICCIQYLRIKAIWRSSEMVYHFLRRSCCWPLSFVYHFYLIKVFLVFNIILVKGEATSFSSWLGERLALFVVFQQLQLNTHIIERVPTILLLDTQDHFTCLIFDSICRNLSLIFLFFILFPSMNSIYFISLRRFALTLLFDLLYLIRCRSSYTMSWLWWLREC